MFGILDVGDLFRSKRLTFMRACDGAFEGRAFMELEVLGIYNTSVFRNSTSVLLSMLKYLFQLFTMMIEHPSAFLPFHSHYHPSASPMPSSSPPHTVHSLHPISLPSCSSRPSPLGRPRFPSSYTRTFHPPTQQLLVYALGPGPTLGCPILSKPA